MSAKAVEMMQRMPKSLCVCVRVGVCVGEGGGALRNRVCLRALFCGQSVIRARVFSLSRKCVHSWAEGGRGSRGQSEEEEEGGREGESERE